jgi:hypothetical protein
MVLYRRRRAFAVLAGCLIGFGFRIWNFGIGTSDLPPGVSCQLSIVFLIVTC